MSCDRLDRLTVINLLIFCVPASPTSCVSDRVLENLFIRKTFSGLFHNRKACTSTPHFSSDLAIPQQSTAKAQPQLEPAFTAFFIYILQRQRERKTEHAPTSTEGSLRLVLAVRLIPRPLRPRRIHQAGTSMHACELLYGSYRLTSNVRTLPSSTLSQRRPT